MKKSPLHIHSPGRRVAAFLCALGLLLIGLAAMACTGETPPVETTPSEPVTLPDLTDNRRPTDVSALAERLETAFSTAEPVSVADLAYTVAEDGVTITGYTGGEVVVVLPDTVEGKPVIAIAEKAFAGMGNLKALSIPDSVITVGIGALAGCDSLSTLQTPVYTCHTAPYFGALFGATTYEINAAHVPTTLSTLLLTKGDTIPDYAFHDCNGLEVVSLPESITEIGHFAFYSCDKLTYMPLSHTALVEIGEHALTNASELRSLELPATVSTMGFAMLEGCGKLESLTLPFVGTANTTPAAESDPSGRHLAYLFGARDYTHSAGYIPASLMSVTLTEGCREIPANAFYECASIREIILPEGLEAIGYRAFYGCAMLSGIDLPATLLSLGDSAFQGCIRLVSVTGGEGLTTIGIQAFMDCLSVESLILPATVTVLPNAAFAGCRSLVTLTAPGVTSVGSETFRHCDKLTGWDVVEPIID